MPVLRALSAALPFVLLAACQLLPDPALAPPSNQGTAAALLVRQHAVRMARSQARGATPACRPYGFQPDPSATRTTLSWTFKSPGRHNDALQEHVTWQRDSAGNVARTRQISSRLPDGRTLVRTLEERLVDGQIWSAIDGRFADASRVRGLPEQLQAGAFEGVDQVLSMISVTPRGNLVPSGEEAPSLCPPPPDALHHLPEWSGAALELGPRLRRGWIRWEETGSGAQMTLEFEELLRAGPDSIQAPSEVWPVDPDPSWTLTQGFLARGLEEGWLQEGRRVGDAPPE